jgi:hypothetical protein
MEMEHMRVHRSFVALPIMLMVAFSIAGCTARSPQLQALSNHDSASSASINNAVTPAIYVADPQSNDVYVFSPSGTLTATLTGFKSPAGLAVDSVGNLYVADQANQVVKVFSPGGTTPFLTLDDGGFYPTGIVTDSADNVYVANLCSGAAGTVSCTGNGSVYKFPKGSSTHTTVYDTSAIHAPFYLAFEGTNKLLWADGWPTEGSTTPIVGHWSKPSSFVTSAIAIKFPGTLQFDKNDNLAVDDQVGPAKVSTLYVFPHGALPASSSFPLWTDTHTGCDVVAFALNSNDTDVWTACFKIILSSGSRPDIRHFIPGESQKIAYPGGGPPTLTIASGRYESGIAVAPVSGN